VSAVRFAMMNHVVNPVVRALLRSPFHGLASGRLLLITVTGRRSGDSFTIPTGYRRDGERVVISVGWPERKRWWRNLRGDGAPVGLLVAGERLSGRAVARGDERSGVRVEVDLDPGGEVQLDRP
jgi:F420H(2)-dependent quinone reductase